MKYIWLALSIISSFAFIVIYINDNVPNPFMVTPGNSEILVVSAGAFYALYKCNILEDKIKNIENRDKK